MPTPAYPVIRGLKGRGFSFSTLVAGALVAGALCSGQVIAGDVEPRRTVGLWEPFSPPENPVTEEKRVLGKILFWDEQLSSDNTISCGTCHIPSEGGVDPRPGTHPAFDGIFGTEDDVRGSMGLIATDQNGEYIRSHMFDLEPQVTNRRVMSNFVSMFGGNLFWDGRAEGTFIDPVTNEVLSMASSGLEVQSLMPITNDVEMAFQHRDWGSIIEKLDRVIPMALASDIPEDMADALEVDGSYGELFARAFGDPEITAGRIGFALATYERTLIPDQTPWDLWNAGDDDAMTPLQKEGLLAYQNQLCITCHNAPLFGDFTFLGDGVRPIIEDLGRGGITGVNVEMGLFKTPSLRNVGLRDRFMHTGGLETMNDVFDHYAHRNGRSPAGATDFRIATPIEFSSGSEAAAIHFLNTALTDPRVASETFPFDRPKLHTELEASNPLISEVGNAGTSGYVPKMIAVTPPNIGNLGFKVGMDFALGGAQAWVAVSSSPPTNGVVASDELLGPITLNGMGPGEGYGTMMYPIDDSSMEGQTFYMQWIVADANAKDGFARSQVAAVTPFCSMSAPCAPVCRADLDGDGELSFFDVSDFLDGFAAQDPVVDFDDNGSFDFFDVSAFLDAFGAGCP